ncbi:MBL fold metallo-hydrolase [Pseudonocardia sp. GCM10023141]|uniref:MBL fold metallo-hydrolase n=1 Tax=Pseudonocardia sp. GCM10023141 TaxID=3252653 RepID=UPI00361269A5
MVDTGFVGHADQTCDWARAQAGGRIEMVVNTHWHADHVGGNAALQATVDQALDDQQRLQLGEAEWQVVATPGHTPGQLCLWQPDERLLAVGDALSDYDVGRVATATAVASLERLDALHPRVLIPAHGPIPADHVGALAQARRRAQRLVDDPDGAVWYGARRIFAYALMIRGGIPVDAVEDYLLDRAWLTDAARLLRRSAPELVAELVDTMRRSGAVVEPDRRLHAAAEHAPVEAATLDLPWPRDRPSTEGNSPR